MKMKILITGVSGYIGSCLYFYLKQKFEVFGIDKIDTKLISAKRHDLRNAKKLDNYLKKEKPDLILSDMSVNLSGIKLVDDESNLDLNLFCLELSKKILSDRGSLLIKTFSNQNLKKLKNLFAENFEKVIVEKPPASKTSSAEVYLLGLVPK